jgi:putative ABC transport system permease protein
MMRSFRRLLVEDPGFSTANTITTSVNLMAAGYDTARAHRFQDDLLQRTRAISGVSGVAIARSQPLSTRPYDNGPIATDDYAPSRDERPTADYNAVTPEYFATLGIPVLAGRDFGSADAVTSAPVAIVSRALAQRYWPNASPIGKRLRLRTTWMQVVGVVGDIKYRSLTQTPGMLFYVPLAQLRPTAVGVFIRTAQDNSASIAPEVLRAIHAIDQNVSPYEIVSLREQVSRSTAGPRIVVVLLMLFSGVALVLAAIGLYGVLAYMISQSTRELGVRMALGASPSQVVRLVVSSGLRLTFPGIVIGVVVGLGTTRLLGDLLFRVGPRDPVVFAAVVGVMTFASLVACSLPGWRASRLDPVRALRA